MYRDECLQEARAIAGRREVLYHGTRHLRSVLRMNTLFCSYPGDKQISFTRSPEVAAYVASIERDNDEGEGAVLVFNRRALQNRYRLDLWHDFHEMEEMEEMEERVWGRDIPEVQRYLLGIAMVGRKKRNSRDRRRNNRLFQMTLALRAEGVAPELAQELVHELGLSNMKAFLARLSKAR